MSVKLRPDHEIGLNMSYLVVFRLGFGVLPVRNRERVWAIEQQNRTAL